MKHIFILFLVLSLGSILISCSSNLPGDVAEAYDQLPAKIDFNYHVRPILSDRCFACHGPDENARKANFRLDTEEAAFAKLEDGESYGLLRHKPFDSESIVRILSNDPDLIMPPPESKISLSASEKAILIKWLEQGAAWKKHWSFIAPQKAPLPSVKNEQLVQNPIDHFILKKLEDSGLSFSEKADKRTLIRRLYLDLIGLPPSLEAVDHFLRDDSPNALEKAVDNLLASPNFGERWAWDWLDAARYSDTNGFQADPVRKMWPWRDWVVKAVNDNMPYDQFTIEQLAGDLLPDAATEQILATAFNRNHMYNGEGGRVPEETRVENVFDRLETTATIWMGLTFNCSRCHDHKFDPITQKEYFQLYDYFNQTSESGKPNDKGMTPPILDLSPPLEQQKVVELKKYLEQVGEKVSEYERKIFPSASGIPAESAAAAGVDGMFLYQLKFPPRDREPYFVKLASQDFKTTDPNYALLLKELEEALSAKRTQSQKNLQVMVMDQLEQPRSTFILEKGAYDKPTGEPVGSGVPKILPPLPADTPDNRLALAKWLVSRDHPLTARVTVNRFWQALFGRGIVKTTDDFGTQGAFPTHPELLDWLAVDFMESGWDVKALLRKMVLSYTYQQSSKLSAELLELDPENKLLSKGGRYRLPSWMIRDQALAVSGLLHDSIGGPSVKPYQPEGIWEEATFGQQRYVQDEGDALYRRSLYIFWRRIVGPTMFFDNASRQVCTVKPILTNAPQHALVTLNDITYLEAARVMAERVLTAKSTEEEQVKYAFQLATLRLPEPAELQVLKRQLEKFRKAFREAANSVDEFLAVGAYPVNSELDKVEYAAFSALCSTILNLDETITKQ